MANKENINKVIETIKACIPGVHFSMSDYLFSYDLDQTSKKWLSEILERSKDPLKESEKDNCGTVGCIAGFCVLTMISDKQGAVIQDYDEIEDETGREYLGITETQALQLFNWDELIPNTLPSLKAFGEVTREDAVKVLEHLRDTNEVDWSIID